VAEFAAGDPGSGAALGVHVHQIALDPAPLQPRFEPGSPYADEAGYVHYPNVDPIIEQMNAMEASRGYEANVAAIEAAKAMMSVALELLS
jgi:flagellar basal-body rod protein FlgC